MAVIFGLSGAFGGTILHYAWDDITRLRAEVKTGSDIFQGYKDELKKAKDMAIKELEVSAREAVKHEAERQLADFTRPANLLMETANRAQVIRYTNTSPKTKMITISAYNLGMGNFLCANVSSEKKKVPSKAGGAACGETTTAKIAFYSPLYPSTFTFIVPSGYHYSVMSNIGQITIEIWAEVEL